MSKYFINEKEVNKEKFEKEWNKEGYTDLDINNKEIPYPVPNRGRWGISKEFSIRNKK